MNNKSIFINISFAAVIVKSFSSSLPFKIEISFVVIAPDVILDNSSIK